MKTTYQERLIMTESPDSVLLESAKQTLRMIASAHVYHDGRDEVILNDYRKMAEKELALIELKQRQYARALVFGEADEGYSDMEVASE